jgi:hypothetical protein
MQHVDKIQLLEIYVPNGEPVGCASAVVAAAGGEKDNVAETAANEEDAAAELVP